MAVNGGGGAVPPGRGSRLAAERGERRRCVAGAAGEPRGGLRQEPGRREAGQDPGVWVGGEWCGVGAVSLKCEGTWPS